MVVMTWNLGRRSHPEHARMIASSRADVVALQEVSPTWGATIAHALAQIGLDPILLT